MTCYHPVTAFRVSSGKTAAGVWPITFNQSNGDLSQALKIPCGTCIGCRLDRAKSWALRCIHESKLHDKNAFITLTYNDKNLYSRCGIYDDQNSKINDVSLNKRDWVLFMKKLRKKYERDHKIRFFHCGEYGKNFRRPHHHACLFNHDFEDKVLWDTRNGVPFYRSKILESLWPYGYSTIGEVTFESAAYVAGYVTKKVLGSAADSHYDGREPEYVSMSRRPGIGKPWFEKYQADVISQDAIILEGGLKLRPPRYYDYLYQAHHPKEMEEIKERRLENVKHDLGASRLRQIEESKIYKQSQQKRSYES